MPASVEQVEGPETTGVPLLPIARVKRILSVDPDIQNVSQQATFVITKATELFVKHLAERGFTQGKAESKSKKTLQYKDIANALARSDHLEFLTDIAPQTTTWGAHKAKKQREAAGINSKDAPLPAGQTTLDVSHRPRSNPADISILSATPEESAGSGPAAPTTNGEPRSPAVEAASRRSISLTNGHSMEHAEEASDVEMS